jgi:hypothetical protein
LNGLRNSLPRTQSRAVDRSGRLQRREATARAGRWREADLCPWGEAAGRNAEGSSSATTMQRAPRTRFGVSDVTSGRAACGRRPLTGPGCPSPRGRAIPDGPSASRAWGAATVRSGADHLGSALALSPMRSRNARRRESGRGSADRGSRTLEVGRSRNSGERAAHRDAGVAFGPWGVAACGGFELAVAAGDGRRRWGPRWGSSAGSRKSGRSGPPRGQPHACGQRRAASLPLLPGL